MPAIALPAGKQAPTILYGPGLIEPGATNLNGTLLDPILTDFVGQMSIATLRGAGYNVVTWDPRGEWRSGGTLELNSPDYEARDVSAIISWLAEQPEVQLDDPLTLDPRIGMVGVSYGGGIQLVTAATDHRVDAIVPTITYNSLKTSLYKNEAFKNGWGPLLSVGLGLTGARVDPRLYPASDLRVADRQDVAIGPGPPGRAQSRRPAQPDQSDHGTDSADPGHRGHDLLAAGK